MRTIERTIAMTGTRLVDVPSSDLYNISVQEDAGVTGGVLTFRGKTSPHANLEAIEGANTIDLSSPQSLNVKDSSMVQLEVTGTATGTATAVNLLITYRI